MPNNDPRAISEPPKQNAPMVTDVTKDPLIWQIYAAHTDYVKHFNTVQSTYRTFASTWILAAFAGIVATTSNMAMVVAICILSIPAMLIFQSLDLCYHTLLKSVIKRQEEMEHKHATLIPDTVHQMRADLNGVTFTFSIKYFYLGAISIFAILACLASFAWYHSFTI